MEPSRIVTMNPEGSIQDVLEFEKLFNTSGTMVHYLKDVYLRAMEDRLNVVFLPKRNLFSVMDDCNRLNYLQKLLDEGQYTGKVLLRKSTMGRGWRLSETGWTGAVPSVRKAIDEAIANKLYEEYKK